jgi:REP element-mobilizing transposase RayT
MNDVESLSHTKWECKYHIVYIPKYPRRRCTVLFANNWEKCSSSWQCSEGAG